MNNTAVRRWLSACVLVAACVAVAVLHGGVLRAVDPRPTPTGERRFQCLSYDPRHHFSELSPEGIDMTPQVSRAWIAADLRRLVGVTRCVRTYYTTRGM